MISFQRILVATDFKAASASVLREAIEMAKGSGAELLIAHAYHPPNVAEAQAVAGGVYEEWDRNLRAEVEKKLEASVKEAREAGITARPLILAGTAYEALVDAAKENKADLVMVGTHGRKGVARFFLGSVASRVIATAPCPVMTVPAA